MTCHVPTNHSSSPHVTSQPTTLLHLTPQATSWHQNRSHHHHGTAEGSFTWKKWFGHRAGPSPCAHSIGKFLICYVAPPARPGTTCSYICFFHRITNHFLFGECRFFSGNSCFVVESSGVETFGKGNARRFVARESGTLAVIQKIYPDDQSSDLKSFLIHFAKRGFLKLNNGIRGPSPVAMGIHFREIHGRGDW